MNKTFKLFSVSVLSMLMLLVVVVPMSAEENNPLEYDINLLMEEIENNFTYENGVFLINENEINRLIDGFDFASMNREYGTNYDKGSFREKTFELIFKYKDEVENRQSNRFKRYLGFPQHNAVAVESRWNSIRIWIPSHRVEAAAKSFEGDLDFSSADDRLELLAEAMTWAYRAKKAVEMRNKNTGSGIVYDFNHFTGVLTIIDQKGPNPF